MTRPRKRGLLSWSSGKDSAWTLHVLRERAAAAADGHVEGQAADAIDLCGLLTTVNATHDRVAMHAVRRTLLAEQARAVGLPLWEVPIPSPCTNEQYEAAMAEVMTRASREGVQVMAFGDLFLEDIRAYREEKLAGTGVAPVFPLWRLPTDALAETMLQAGLEAWITAVDPEQVPAELCGRRWDRELIAELPAGADPCGENGEFHTFVVDGPMFRERLDVRPGEVVEREGFVYADLLPASGAPAGQSPTV